MSLKVIRVTAIGALVAAGATAMTACSMLTQGRPGQSTSIPASGNSSAAAQPSSPDSKVSTVPKDILVKTITDQLARAGVTPQAVTCQQDLLGQVGQTAACDVSITAVNSFEPIVTVTVVNGDKVSYAITPSVNKSQLEVAVKDMVTRSTNAAPDSVVCETGLDGKVGAVAFCNVTAGGATNRQAVSVSQVQGLSMNYGLAQLNGNAPAQSPGPNAGAGQTLPKNVAEGALMAQLKHAGQNPDSVTCAGDMPATVGATLACTAVAAGQNQNYLLTLSAVSNGSYTFKYQLAQ
ncbi:hypothetical protein ABIA30_005261 [Mycobacterium sp. MAA66]|uniref:DUF4333 domain-containing protein n=1 Tax=Mycobacterium sp. MAA66 TaxID=3156297 RepID=UPI003511A40B